MILFYILFLITPLLFNLNGTEHYQPEYLLSRFHTPTLITQRIHRQGKQWTPAFSQRVYLHQSISLPASLRQLLQKTTRKTRTHPLPRKNQHQTRKHFLLHILQDISIVRIPRPHPLKGNTKKNTGKENLRLEVSMVSALFLHSRRELDDPILGKISLRTQDKRPKIDAGRRGKDIISGNDRDGR